MSANAIFNDVWSSRLTLPPVHVAEPNGGKAVTGGAPLTVEWSTDVNRAGSGVKLELRKDQSWVADLGWGWSPDGYEKRAVQLPLMPADSDYRIRAISAADSGIWDESDQPFTITGGPVRVNLPNGGEVWPAKSNQWVWWQMNPYFAGTAVRFELWQNGVKITDLGGDFDPDGESLEQVWVPLDLASGDYKLRAVSVWNPDYFDESDGFITIQGSAGAEQTNRTAVEPGGWGLYE